MAARDAITVVTVPAYAGTLAPASRHRIRRLRRHLIEAMRAQREMRRTDQVALVVAVEPGGFTGTVARTACALCRGWCCSKGGEHAYLDERTMARVRGARPELDARAILRLYVDAAAEPAYADSCVFHGAGGCTLDRSLRSDLCNRYFCNGLAAFVQRGGVQSSVVVTAGEGGQARVSPVLTRRRNS